jgi:hypothetical protein
MSDDDPPVIDLASYRAGRDAARRAPSFGKLQASIEGDALCFSLSELDWRLLMSADHVRWLRLWIEKYEAAQRASVNGPNSHRCHSCRLVKWIECRGHRRWGETKIHFAVEVLERKTWSVYKGPDQPGAKEERPARTRAVCQRVVKGSRAASQTWDEVTCSLCLRKKPRAVP